ncbi:MAG: GNAT family N-acetyltransferase [Eubacterium sp.]|nr:GNAT family N-acetyltransferase [Eubacterium sp.]
MSVIFESERLIIRGSDMEYLDAIFSYYRENRDFFERYEPEQGDTYYTREYQEKLLEFEVKNMERGSSLYFYYSLKEDPERVIGSISFSRLRKEPYASTVFGYNIHEKYQGHGYCTEACAASMEKLFQDYDMHRIESRVLPDNLKSINVLLRLGFFCEGFEKESILIGGKFRDHLRYAYINEDY